MISHIIDPGAYRIAPHQPGIEGHQEVGCRTHIRYHQEWLRLRASAISSLSSGRESFAPDWPMSMPDTRKVVEKFGFDPRFRARNERGGFGNVIPKDFRHPCEPFYYSPSDCL
jgi:hypothetical protein